MKWNAAISIRVTFRRAPQGARGLKLASCRLEITSMRRAPQGARGLKFGGPAVVAVSAVAPRKGRVD